MTMVTVPLAVLIGAASGMVATGVAFASESNEVGEYLAGTTIFCIFSILIFSGIEALINLGGA